MDVRLVGRALLSGHCGGSALSIDNNVGTEGIFGRSGIVEWMQLSAAVVESIVEVCWPRIESCGLASFVADCG